MFEGVLGGHYGLWKLTFFWALTISWSRLLVPRATSHTSQEPWPCNGEDPWLSSKGRTMGVGEVVLGSHETSSIVWSENGPWCGTIAYFVGGKKGRMWFDIICLKLYQFERTTWWYLSVLESNLKYVLLKNENKQQQQQWSPEICVRPTSWKYTWRRFRQTWNLIHSPPCRTPCILFIHEISLLWAFTFVCEVNLDELVSALPFDQWELLDCNGHGPSAFVCEVALRYSPPSPNDSIHLHLARELMWVSY